MVTDKMTVEERYKVIRRVRAAYQRASRGEKMQMLNTLQTATGLSRKHLIDLVNGPGPERKRRRQGRGRKYSGRVDDAIRLIGRLLNWICAERLKPALPATARHLASHGEMQVDEELLVELEEISISTVRRYVKRLRQDEYLLPKPQGRRRYRNSIAAQIPMAVIPWDIERPGHFEVDLVHHGAPDGKGDCAYTVQFIDVKTGWSERIAVLGRSYRRMKWAFEQFRRCPIPVREIHPDNGPEFMNAHLFNFFGEKFKGVHLSRSRPWQKNDNRFVEQKNSTLVRAYVGHEIFTSPHEVEQLNELYDLMRIYYNYFQPVLRQIDRHVEKDAHGVTRAIRKQDAARTPLQRLLDSDVLSQQTRAELFTTYENTNLRLLYAALQKTLNRLLTTKL